MNFIRQPELPQSQDPELAPIMRALLSARAENAAAGNRRALFSRMDALLMGAVEHSTSTIEIAPSSPAGSVRLATIQLRNWKAFARADLIFPTDTNEKTLVVIGGGNGFGKSSILEAYAFALFGRRALSDIGFLIDATGTRRGQQRSYHLHLERALHRSDRARAEGMCSVSLEFETATGPMAVERKWYFDDRGALIEEDEELVVRVGAERVPLPLPEGVTAQDWYQSEIERRIMPASLAPFFIFDGEQVERWADRQLSDQIRMAISSMLGLNELDGLSDDLKAYARDRERGTNSAGAAPIDALSLDIERLEDRIRAEAYALEQIEENLRSHRRTRDAALSELAANGTASHAELQGQLETEHRLTGDRHRLERELIGRVAELGPLLLVGTALRTRVEQGLAADSRQSSAGGIDDDDLETLWDRFMRYEPPLEPDVARALHDRFFASCRLAVDEADQPRRYPPLDRSTSSRIQSLLRSMSGRAGERLKDASDALAQVDLHLAALKSAEARQIEQTARRAEIQAQLGQASALIEEAEQHRGAARHQLEVLRSELAPRLEARDRQAIAERDAQPRLRAAATARTMAQIIDAQRERIANREYDGFAAAVTSSFYALSHKKQITRIEIGAGGAIALFDAAGRDVTDYRLSAGESQLFALALIAAVGALIGDRLPLIVDTPLGRLDTAHRQGVLALFGARRAQTILLTQPEEISAGQLATLAPVLAGAARIEHQLDGITDIGTSTIAPGIDPMLDAA